MVTSIEAVRAAVKAGKIANDMFATDDLTKDEADVFLFTAMLRAYLEARGLVMVPKAATHFMLSTGRMDQHDWSLVLLAAPDPFGGAE